MTRRLLSGLASILLVAKAAGAPEQSLDLDPLRGVRFDQRLGEAVPLDLEFRDADGEAVRLGSLFGTAPVVMAFVYHECPMLCGRVLDGLVAGLGSVPLEAGRDFEVIVVSIDPEESTELSAARKLECVRRYGRPGSEGGWHFLAGEEDAILALTSAAGFGYRYDAERDRFAHPGGILVLTSDGTISRYLLGIEYPPADLRLSLLAAADGSIGSPVDRLLLLCYEWDPARGRYTLAVMKALRWAAVVTVIALVALLWLLSWRSRGCRRSAAAG